MSLLTLLFCPHTTIGSIKLDAALTEVHRSSVEVTQHPVEDGADIADHAMRMPDELRIEGVITDTLMVMGGFISPSGRHKDEYESLRKLEGQLVDVITSLREYKSMAITSIEVPRDAQWSNAMRCTIELRHVRVVKSQTVPSVAAKKAAAAPARDIGKQPAKPAPAATNKSWGATLWDLVF